MKWVSLNGLIQSQFYLRLKKSLRLWRTLISAFVILIRLCFSKKIFFRQTRPLSVFFIIIFMGFGKKELAEIRLSQCEANARNPLNQELLFQFFHSKCSHFSKFFLKIFSKLPLPTASNNHSFALMWHRNFVSNFLYFIHLFIDCSALFCFRFL